MVTITFSGIGILALLIHLSTTSSLSLHGTSDLFTQILADFTHFSLPFAGCLSSSLSSLRRCGRTAGVWSSRSRRASFFQRLSTASHSIVQFLCMPVSPAIKISPRALWRNSSLRWMLLSTFEGREKSVNRKLG
ncbi:hypothetical protein EI94DRAFT_1748658 [Lactarius quietus]|nr:hypothetical protein EI94DRAFT_1748658 [Lactarius quietus]